MRKSKLIQALGEIKILVHKYILNVIYFEVRASRQYVNE